MKTLTWILTLSIGLAVGAPGLGVLAAQNRSSVPADRIDATNLTEMLRAPERLHRSVGLTPTTASDLDVQILDHHVEVRLQNGFARTEVTQSFFNPNEVDLEAHYTFPVPKSGSLAEMTIFAGDDVLEGEVLAKDDAERIYEERKKKGEDAGLAEKDSYLSYRFFVARVPALAETSFRFVYYQPIEIDTGIGRYLYPLEDGGTDELARSFWEADRTVRRNFSFHLVLESAWPIDDVRMPGFEAAAVIDRHEEGSWEVTVDLPGGIELDRDLLVYYRLSEGLPGRMELVPFRADADGSGSFLLVVTPGIDLAPLTGGSDYVFVLDVSGSMEGKIHTLAEGVVRALGTLKPEDRFRIVTFSSSAKRLFGRWKIATPENVSEAVIRLRALGVEGGTNLFSGLSKGLEDLDDDRATSLVLVTDAVANVGEVAPQRFAKLMRSHDVRVFGFLLGNSGNWPLMRTVCDASGGFYAGVSNADDVVGQILLAKSKVTHEALHDARIVFDGVPVHDVTQIRSKVYRGQQLVLFGRYAEPGPLAVRLEATLTGEDKVYETTTVLPAVDLDNPEIERLWALDRIEEIQARIDRGEKKAAEGEQAIEDLGVAYQLVTDHTSMVVLTDAAFAEEGIERRNQSRTRAERQAQARRSAGAATSYRIDTRQPAFRHSAPTTRSSGGSGGGAIDPLSALLAVFLAAPFLVRRGRGDKR